MDEIIKKHWYSNYPKWLRITIKVLLITTVVYYASILFYKTWDLIGKVIHWLTEKRNWWTYTTCLIILGLGVLLSAQFLLGLNPFGKMFDAIYQTLCELKIKVLS